MKRLLDKQSTGALVIVGLVALVVAGAALYLVDKHRWAQARLAELEPRYARLVGLESARADLDRAEAQARTTLAQLAYPASQEATQAGNNAQQRARAVLGRAGLEVLSSQVLPPRTDKQFDRIVLAVRLEGDLLALQSALVALGSEAPAMFVESLSVQAMAPPRPDAAPRLSVQLNLFVLRGRS